MTTTHSIHDVNALLGQTLAAEHALDMPSEMSTRFLSVELATMPESIVFKGVDFGRSMAVYRGLASAAPEGTGDVEIICLGLGHRACERARHQLARAPREFRCDLTVMGAFEVMGRVHNTLYLVGTTR